MQDEVHISSLVALIKPESLPQAVERIDAMPTCEIYAQDQQMGKVVIIAETHSGKALLDIISQIEALDGVINVSPVYHQVDSEQQLQQLACESAEPI